VSGVRLGIVGATGQVGVVARRILAERGFDVAQMRFFASARSAGSTLEWDGHAVTVEDASIADPTGLDIAIFSAGAATSRSWHRASQRPESPSSTTPPRGGATRTCRWW
jgi:aspartate-semialdehyde dehydrogenase